MSSSAIGTVNPNPPLNTNSPLLTPKLYPADSTLLSKTSPIPYPSASSPSYIYSSPVTVHRTLINSTNNSPYLPLHSTPHRNFSHEINQSLSIIKTDTNSLRSTGSTTSSEEQVHPISSQQQSGSTRNRDVTLKNRSLQDRPSVSGTTGLLTNRVPSPSPSLISEREEDERAERELELKRKRLQIYVFVCRCIAYPFNSRQSSDMARKYLKITLVQYGVIKERFLGFLNGKTHIEADEGK